MNILILILRQEDRELLLLLTAKRDLSTEGFPNFRNIF